MQYFRAVTTAGSTPPTISAPLSLISLQPVKKAPIMIPDDKGILRHHQVRAVTAKYIQDIVDAEKKMDLVTQGLTMQSQVVPMPSPTQSAASLTSAPSTSSGISVGSGASTQGEVAQTQRYNSKFIDEVLY